MSRLMRWLDRQFTMHQDPLLTARNPQYVFLLGLSLAACVPLIQGHPGSAALENSLSRPVVTSWGVSLLVGSALALTGIFWRRQPLRGGNREPRWTGLTLERSGMILTAGAIFTYALVIKETAPDVNDVRQALAVNTAYGLICLWRVVQITMGLRWRKRRPQGAS